MDQEQKHDNDQQDQSGDDRDRDERDTIERDMERMERDMERESLQRDIRQVRMMRMLENQRRYMEVAENSAHLLQMLSRVIPETGCPEVDMESESSDSPSDSPSHASETSSPSPDNNDVITGGAQSLWSEPQIMCHIIHDPFLGDMRQHMAAAAGHADFNVHGESFQSNSTRRGRWRTGIPLHVAMGAMTSVAETCETPTSMTWGNMRTAEVEDDNQGMYTFRTVSDMTPSTQHCSSQTDPNQTNTTATQTDRHGRESRHTPENHGNKTEEHAAVDVGTDRQETLDRQDKEDTRDRGGAGDIARDRGGAGDIASVNLSMEATQDGLNTALQDLHTAADTIRQARELLSVFGGSGDRGNVGLGNQTNALLGINCERKGYRGSQKVDGDCGKQDEAATDCRSSEETDGGNDGEDNDVSVFPKPLLVKSAVPSTIVEQMPTTSSTSLSRPLDLLSRYRPPTAPKRVSCLKGPVPTTPRTTSIPPSRANNSRPGSRSHSSNLTPGSRATAWSSNMTKKILSDSVRRYPRVWTGAPGREPRGRVESAGIGGEMTPLVPVEMVNTDMEGLYACAPGIKDSDSNSSNSTGQKAGLDEVEVKQKSRRTITSAELTVALETAVGELRRAGLWQEDQQLGDQAAMDMYVTGLRLDFTALQAGCVNITNNKMTVSGSEVDQFRSISGEACRRSRVENLDKSLNSGDPGLHNGPSDDEFDRRIDELEKDLVVSLYDNEVGGEHAGARAVGNGTRESSNCELNDLDNLVSNKLKDYKYLDDKPGRPQSCKLKSGVILLSNQPGTSSVVLNSKSNDNVETNSPKSDSSIESIAMSEGDKAEAQISQAHIKSPTTRTPIILPTAKGSQSSIKSTKGVSPITIPTAKSSHSSIKSTKSVSPIAMPTAKLSHESIKSTNSISPITILTAEKSKESTNSPTKTSSHLIYRENLTSVNVYPKVSPEISSPVNNCISRNVRNQTFSPNLENDVGNNNVDGNNSRPENTNSSPRNSRHSNVPNIEVTPCTEPGLLKSPIEYARKLECVSPSSQSSDDVLSRCSNSTGDNSLKDNPIISSPTRRQTSRRLTPLAPRSRPTSSRLSPATTSLTFLKRLSEVAERMTPEVLGSDITCPSTHETHTLVQPIITETKQETSTTVDLAPAPDISSTQNEAPISRMSQRSKGLIEKISAIQAEVEPRRVCDSDNHLAVMDQLETCLHHPDPVSTYASNVFTMAMLQQPPELEQVLDTEIIASADVLSRSTPAEDEVQDGVKSATEAWESLAVSVAAESESVADFWQDVQLSQEGENEEEEKPRRRTLSDVFKSCASCLSGTKK